MEIFALEQIISEKQAEVRPPPSRSSPLTTALGPIPSFPPLQARLQAPSPDGRSKPFRQIYPSRPPRSSSLAFPRLAPYDRDVSHHAQKNSPRPGADAVPEGCDAAENAERGDDA